MEVEWYVLGAKVKNIYQPIALKKLPERVLAAR